MSNAAITHRSGAQMKFQPWIVGSGMAGQALARAFQWVAATHHFDVAPPRWVGRSEILDSLDEGSIFCIANPHRLHVERLRQVRDLPGAVICEKPVAVTIEDIDALRDYPKEVAACHGYRMRWGPQTIRQWVEAGNLGELIATEGRYWQATSGSKPRKESWKSDASLSGPFDALMDLGTHWLDMASFIHDDFEPEVSVTLSHKNASSAHRDTHVLLAARWGSCHGSASVSKTAHGWGNHFEIHVIGTKCSLSWNLQDPDGLWLGEGKTRRWLPRDRELHSGLPAFHGLGWMEGYLAIVQSVLQKQLGRPAERTPSLEESLKTSRVLIEAVR